MYDKDLSNKWRVEIDFDEDETHTHATVRAQWIRPWTRRPV